MANLIAAVPPAEQEPVAFTSNLDGKVTKHLLVAWRIYDDGTFSPALLPEPAAGALVNYGIGVLNPVEYRWED